MTLLSHPSHSVRVTASWALRCFCYTTPLRLPKMILTAMEFLQRDLTSITSPAAPSDINLRTLGHAYGLSALVAVASAGWQLESNNIGCEFGLTILYVSFNLRAIPRQ